MSKNRKSKKNKNFIFMPFSNITVVFLSEFVCVNYVLYIICIIL